MQSPMFLNYCRLVFGPFFKWWWAAITGVASILSYLALPEVGLTIPRLWVALGVLGGMLLAFLTLSVVWQGWLLFEERFSDLRVTAINRCEDFGGHYVVILVGPQVVPGALSNCIAFSRVPKFPSALLEIMQTNSKGEHQTRPLWFAQGHLSDFVNRMYEPGDLRVRLLVSRSVVVKYLDPLRPETAE